MVLPVEYLVGSRGGGGLGGAVRAGGELQGGSPWGGGVGGYRSGSVGSRGGGF